MGVEILVDRGAVHDLRNLIALIIVIENTAVQRERAIEQSVLGAEFEGINEFGFERQRMIGIGITHRELWQHGPRRIGPASLVAMRVGAVDKRLIGEGEFRCPVQRGTAGDRIPLLVNGAGGGIARAIIEKLARNIDEMLLVLGPPQTGSEFQGLEDVVIGLAEGGIGIERVGVLAKKVIVPLIVEAADWIGIDIDASIHLRLAAAQRRIMIFEAAITGETLVIVCDIDIPRHPARVRRVGVYAFCVGECGERVDEDVVVFFRLVMEVIAADAEIERAGEMRCQAEFLARLPGMFFRKILGKDTATATQLRIAELAHRGGLGDKGARRGGTGTEDTLRGCKAIVILRRPEEIVVEAGFRSQRQRRRDLIVGV